MRPTNLWMTSTLLFVGITPIAVLTPFNTAFEVAVVAALSFIAGVNLATRTQDRGMVDEWARIRLGSEHAGHADSTCSEC